LSSSTIDTYFSGICSPFSDCGDDSTLLGAVPHVCELWCTVTFSSFRNPFEHLQPLLARQFSPGTPTFTRSHAVQVPQFNGLYLQAGLFLESTQRATGEEAASMVTFGHKDWAPALASMNANAESAFTLVRLQAPIDAIALRPHGHQVLGVARYHHAAPGVVHHKMLAHSASFYWASDARQRHRGSLKSRGMIHGWQTVSFCVEIYFLTG
jgi:hypothetical protein